MHGSAPSLVQSGKGLEALYRRYNRRCFIHPDPLEFLYRFSNPQDREIFGLLASSLAYGKVEQILRSLSAAFLQTGSSPFLYLCHSSFEEIKADFEGFRHRFTTGADIALLLWSAKRLIQEHGSLYECFLAGYDEGHETVLPALSAFVGQLRRDACCTWCGFLPSPERGSPCKRLNLFLRWMVREDDVDPGGWKGICPSKLIVPLDTHMHRIGLMLGLTKRKQADLRTAVEITEAFRALSPEDPVRYDFVLTRFGIRNDMDKSGLTELCANPAS